MSLPYFNMYPRDFEADTSHLTLEEDGAYNRLLRLCWMTPGCSIPDDDAWIMRRMRVDAETFERVVKVVLEEFFVRSKGRCSNARLAREYSSANDAHEKRVSAGKRGGNSKRLKTNNSVDSNAKAMLKQPEPEPEPYINGGGGSACAREDAPTDRELVLEAMGVGPDGVIGPSRFTGTQSDMAELARWLELPGLTIGEITKEIRETMAAKPDGPPSRWRYFTPAMTRLSAVLTAPALQPDATARASPRRSTQPDLAAAMARLEAQGRA